jgi:hypothetical protein
VSCLTFWSPNLGNSAAIETGLGGAMPDSRKPPDLIVVVIVIVLLVLGILCAVIGLTPLDAPGLG